LTPGGLNPACDGFGLFWLVPETLIILLSSRAYLRTTVVNLARKSLCRRLQERRAWRDADDPRSADPG
jgi:hypothetical protein